MSQANAKVLHPLLTGDDPLSARYFDLIVLRKGKSFWRGSKHYAHVLFHDRSRESESFAQSTLLVGPLSHGSCENALDAMLNFTTDLLAKYLPHPPVAAMGM